MLLHIAQCAQVVLGGFGFGEDVKDAVQQTSSTRNTILEDGRAIDSVFFERLHLRVSISRHSITL